MQINLSVALLSLAFYATVLAAHTSADEPITLIGTIVKWRYPDSEIGKSEMSDAATMDADEKRTVPSTLLKATLTTHDPVEEVVAFYRDLLKRDANRESKLAIDPKAGRSVIFSDDSDGRSVALHTILINSANTSTTIVITRGEHEELTHISWKQYLKHEIGK